LDGLTTSDVSSSSGVMATVGIAAALVAVAAIAVVGFLAFRKRRQNVALATAVVERVQRSVSSSSIVTPTVPAESLHEQGAAAAAAAADVSAATTAATSYMESGTPEENFMRLKSLTYIYGDLDNES